jgi:tRNA(Ile2) C34 agmatinyltransferase TiaS
MTRIMQIFYASGLPGTGKRENLESSCNNDGLDEWRKSIGKGETTGLASICGGTSTY